MDLRLLQIFCIVYEEQSFSKAAQRLRLAQPTVSEHIKRLEGQLETPLFTRLSRAVQPTRAGEYLYGQARRVGELQRSIDEGMGRFLQNLVGHLAIGASTIPGEYLLPRLIAQFRQDHPGVRVSVTIRGTRAVLDELSAGRVDVGFVGARMDDGNRKFLRFASDRLVLIVPQIPRWKGVRSISLRELAGEPFLVRERGSGTRAVLESRLAELGLRLEDLQIVSELGSTTAIKEGVKERVGASILSNLAVRTEIAAGLLREVVVRELRSFRRDFYIVVDTRRPVSPLCEEFLARAAKPRTKRGA